MRATNRTHTILEIKNFKSPTSITNAIRLKATSSIEMNLAWEQNDV